MALGIEVDLPSDSISIADKQMGRAYRSNGN